MPSRLSNCSNVSHSPFQNSTVGYRTILNATLPHLKTAEVFNILQDYACFDFPFAKDVNQGDLYLVRYEAYLMR